MIRAVVRPASVLRYQIQRPAVRFLSSDSFLDSVEVTERVLTVVKAFDKVDESKVTPESKFTDDLGLDSLDIVEAVMALEEEFVVEIPDAEAERITDVAAAIAFICAHPQAK